MKSKVGETLVFKVIKLFLLSAFVVGVLASIGGYFYLKNHYETALGSIDESFYLEVKRGYTARTVLRELEQKGLIDSAQHTYWASRVFSEIAGLQAGVYQIETGSTLTHLWRKLSNGEQHLFSITFAEGLNFAEWQNIIADHNWLTQEWETLSAEQIVNQLDLPFDADHPEGLLYPETYLFHAYASDREIYQQAANQMTQVVNELWESRAEDLPIRSAYEALILASIVEKETGADGERGLVASVFVNRLRRGMRLQSDPTIIYGLGERYRGVIYRSDIQEHTPYNTYRINGLPPTPIAMPGLEALEATLNPPHSDYFYFVSRNDGTHVFSESLIEHNRAVQQYQRN